MKGINTGVLSNAFPLTPERIKELDRQVLELRHCYVFLNENAELCFALPSSVDFIKDLAWNKAYELFKDNEVVIKKVYVKTGLKTYALDKYELTTDEYEVTENEFGGLTYRIGGTK